MEITDKEMSAILFKGGALRHVDGKVAEYGRLLGETGDPVSREYFNGAIAALQSVRSWMKGQ
jgi:hypothetical protein